jgi:hypothetical protein
MHGSRERSLDLPANLYVSENGIFLRSDIKGVSCVPDYILNENNLCESFDEGQSSHTDLSLNENILCMSFDEETVFIQISRKYFMREL